MKNIQYINAGAGSGKTTKLTQILSEELGKSDAKIRPSEVILTTFTELAASEFREVTTAALSRRSSRHSGRIGFCDYWHCPFCGIKFYSEILVSHRSIT